MATCDTFTPETSPTKVRKEPSCGTEFQLPSFVESDADCVEINGGDFLFSDDDNMAYAALLNSISNEAWDTNLNTT